MTEIGNRARIGLSSPQPLVAEVTVESIRSLALRPGAPGHRELEGDRDPARRALASRRSDSSNAAGGGTQAR